MIDGSRAAAAMVAFRLAAVPPEKPPFIPRTRPFTRATGPPSRALAASCRNQTPSSKGMESKPHENTIRAPLFLAVAS
jgi:hypothetical protein